MQRHCRSITLIAGLALTAACSSEPAEITRAREVLAAKTAEDSGYHEYALSIMAGSPATHARAMVLEAIAQGNRKLAGEAIRGLDGPPDEQTVAALKSAFGKTGSVKMLAAAALARSGDGEAVEWLAAQLAQSGYLLVTPAMVALAESEHEEAARASLAELIESDDVSIRNEGYSILGAVGRPWATQQLLASLNREFGKERAGPIAALGQTGDPSAAGAILNWAGTQGLVLASLQALGNLGDTGSLGTIEPMLDHEQPLVRVYASVAAARLGAVDSAGKAIAPLVTHEDEAIRRDLAVQLSGVEGEQATGFLRAMAADEDKLVRTEAYRSLIGRRAEGLDELFAAGAHDPAYEVASVALAGLAVVGGPEHVEAVAPLLDSDNPYLAISAAHAVLALGADQGAAKVD